MRARTREVIKAVVGLVLLMLLVIIGCAEELADHEIASSSLSREMNPNVAPEDFAAQVEANTAFAFDLYHYSSSSTEAESVNLFFSPHSISIALAMTWAGARGRALASRELGNLQFNADTIDRLARAALRCEDQPRWSRKCTPR